MVKKFIKFLLSGVIFLLSVAHSTTDVGQAFYRSDAVIRGFYLGSSYKKLPNGEVVTVASIKVSQISQKSSEKLYREKLGGGGFKLIIPGGEWGGVSYRVPGSPTFIDGEEVLLFVKKGKYGYMLSDLALGKLKRKEAKYSEKQLFESMNHHIVSVDDISLRAKERFGAGLRDIPGDYFVYQRESGSRKNSRSIASVESSPDRQSDFVYWWGVLILGVLGGLSRILNRK